MTKTAKLPKNYNLNKNGKITIVTNLKKKNSCADTLKKKRNKTYIQNIITLKLFAKVLQLFGEFSPMCFEPLYTIYTHTRALRLIEIQGSSMIAPTG